MVVVSVNKTQITVNIEDIKKIHCSKIRSEKNGKNYVVHAGRTTKGRPP